MKNVFVFGSGYKRFSRYWWRHWLRLASYTTPCRFAYQRITRGWADCDTWAVDDWLCEILPPAIAHLREHTHSHPVEMTGDMWRAILSDIAEGFKAYERSQEVNEKFIKRSSGKGIKEFEYDWKSIHEEQARELVKFQYGMQLMIKYFGSMWD